jgi:acyl-CoA dehydrogenase
VRALARDGWLTHAVGEPLDVRTLCLARETLARHDGLADFAFAMQGLGSGPISLFGSEDQRARYLHAVRSGEKVAAFALSEPDAGSDVAAMTTRAAGGRLTGTKTWISNGGIADFYTVFAREDEGISAFIVEASEVEIAERIDVIAPHPLATLRFDDTPAEPLGPPGAGMKIALSTLDVFRSTVGAAALGFARRALDETLTRVRERRLFGGPMAELELVQAKLAEMALEIDASALLVYRAAWTKDTTGGRVTREAAMAKLYATEAAQRVIDAAVQLHGALGVTSGHPVETLYREIRALRIYEGASEVQQLIIARELLR